MGLRGECVEVHVRGNIGKGKPGKIFESNAKMSCSARGAECLATDKNTGIRCQREK